MRCKSAIADLRARASKGEGARGDWAMATFGKDVEIFQQIAAGNLQVLRDLVAPTTRLVQQPMPFQTLTPRSPS